MQDYIKIYNEWITSSLINEEERNELISIKDNDEQIKDRFYKDLEFGTGGLRGVMGVGSNRMNRFVIKRASQGLANYLNKNKLNPSVAIAYDSRNHSKEFAIEAATTLAENGIRVYIYDELMPTPALSYAVRYLKCDAGIVITASHNPKIYNGYKVYGNDGCQCTDELAKAILNEILTLDIFKDVKNGNYNDLINKNLIEIIKQDCIDSYINTTLKQSLYNENKILDIVYTPLNGAGFKLVKKVLEIDGFTAIGLVDEQIEPDGNFPTIPYPNPELKEALALGVKKLINDKMDILIATDPDSDRCGVVVNVNNKPHYLSGNEVGILLFDALYHKKKDDYLLSNNPTIIKTIVTSDMANIMAQDYNVRVIETLTGFKYIGEQMSKLEKENALDDYLFGFEESCGYLSNKDVRDKDAVNAALLICEVANHLKLENKTLCDRLNELYQKYGEYKTDLMTYEFLGIEGMNKIKSIMDYFRSEEINDLITNIDHIGDYLKGYIFYKNKKVETNLPTSNVIKFFFKDNSTVTVRPSGTEPKLKIYFFALGKDRLEQLKEAFKKLISQ